jgi:hypothetical protein
MMPLPERDSHAYTLASMIIATTREAYREIHAFADRREYTNAHHREEMLIEEVVRLCTQFNKDMFRINEYLRGQMADVIACLPSKPFVLKPAPENE